MFFIRKRENNNLNIWLQNVWETKQILRIYSTVVQGRDNFSALNDGIGWEVAFIEYWVNSTSTLCQLTDYVAGCH